MVRTLKSDPMSAILSTLNPTGSQKPLSVSTHHSMVVKRITSVVPQLNILQMGQAEFREEPLQEVPEPLLLTPVLIHGGGFNEMSVLRNHPV